MNAKMLLVEIGHKCLYDYQYVHIVTFLISPSEAFLFTPNTSYSLLSAIFLKQEGEWLFDIPNEVRVETLFDFSHAETPCGIVVSVNRLSMDYGDGHLTYARATSTNFISIDRIVFSAKQSNGGVKVAQCFSQ